MRVNVELIDALTDAIPGLRSGLSGVPGLEPTDRRMIDVIGERNLTHRLAGLYALQDLTCLMFGQL